MKGWPQCLSSYHAPLWDMSVSELNARKQTVLQAPSFDRKLYDAITFVLDHKSPFEQLHADDQQRMLRTADAALAAIEPLLEAMRRHIRSYEPGTLIGSELNVALHLRDLDGDVWEPWCVPGEIDFKNALAAIEAAPLTDEQIETAAKAIWDDGLPDEDVRWHELNDNTRHTYRQEAAAAIRAYRSALAARPRDATHTKEKE